MNGRASPYSIAALALVGLLSIFMYLSNRSTQQQFERESRAQLAAQQQEQVVQHEALLRGCERGNLQRADVRRSANALKRVLLFTATAIDGSIAAGDIPPARVDGARTSADTYRQIADSLKSQPIVNCAKEYPAP